MSGDYPKHLSVSQVSTLRKCGESYRLSRVWRVPELPGWARIGGSAVHGWTEEYDLHTLGGDAPRSFADIFEELTLEEEEKSGLDRSQFKASGRATKALPNKEDRKWWLENGPSMCQRWVNWRNMTPLDLWIAETGEPGIEVDFKVEVGDVTVVGYIDRVFVDHRTGNIIVVDLKSGREVDDDFQLGTYKIALMERFGLENIRYGAYWYARTGSTGPMVALNEWTRQRAEWEYAKAEERRARGDWQPVRSNMCGWCGVRDYCIYVGGEKAGEIRPPWVPMDDWEGEEAA